MNSMNNQTNLEDPANLSSRKLWDLLKQSQFLQLSPTHCQIIKHELARRNHLQTDLSGKVPH